MHARTSHSYVFHLYDLNQWTSLSPPPPENSFSRLRNRERRGWGGGGHLNCLALWPVENSFTFGVVGSTSALTPFTTITTFCSSSYPATKKRALIFKRLRYFLQIGDFICENSFLHHTSLWDPLVANQFLTFIVGGSPLFFLGVNLESERVLVGEALSP